MSTKKQGRVEWLDVYKGLVMILVVVGHATGMFNMYIYQFHMAAFFFASGYLDKSETKSLHQVLINKFFGLYLPLLTFVVLGSLFEKILSVLHIYGVLYGGDFTGISLQLRQFIFHGNLYFQSLGACWFILVLFGVFILQKLILMVCGKRNGLYFLTSIILFLVGYGLIENKNWLGLGPFSVDLIFLANLYFAVGALVRQYSLEHPRFVPESLWFRLGVLIFNLAVFYYFSHIQIVVNDWPSRSFTTPWWDALAAFNGIVFIWNIAALILLLPKQWNRVLSYIGENTMGILVFHFFVFKICLALLWLNGKVPRAEIAGVVPGEQTGRRYWCVISVFAILGSLLLWRACKSIPWLSFCTGREKEKYKKIENWTMPESVRESDWYVAARRVWNKARTPLERAREWNLRHSKISGLILLGVSTAIFLGNLFVSTGATGIGDFVEILAYGDKISYDSGFYSDGWCAPEATLSCGSRRPRSLQIDGYYPQMPDGTQQIQLYVDDVLVQTYELESNTFHLEVELSSGQEHQVRILSNFEAEKNQGDVRTLAFVAQTIRLS